MVIDSNELLIKIKKLIKNIYRVKSYTEYIYIIKDISNLVDMYEEITGIKLNLKIPKIEYYEQEYFKKCFSSDTINIYEYLSNRKMNTDISERYLDTFDNSEYLYLGREYSQKRILDKEYFEIIENFLNDFDERLYKKYIKLLFEGKIDKDTDKYYYTDITKIIYNPPEQYILLDKNSTIGGIETFIHELAHTYEFEVLSNISKKQMLFSDFSYYELYANYVELEFMDYLKRNYIYKKDTVFSENAYYDYFKKILEVLYNSKDIEVFYDNNYLNTSESYIYGISKIIAILMIERDDKKDTIKRLDTFVSLEGLINKSEQLDVLGIKYDDLMDTKALSKRLKNHTKEIEKYK